MNFPSGSGKKGEKDLESGDGTKVESPPNRLFKRPGFTNTNEFTSMNHGEYDRSRISQHRRMLFEESPSMTDLMMIKDEGPSHNEGTKVAYIPEDYDDFVEDEDENENYPLEEKLDHGKSSNF